MARELSFENFLKELGARLGAAAVVVGVFFGLGYVNRTDLLGLSSRLGTQRTFFVVGFVSVGILPWGGFYSSNTEVDFAPTAMGNIERASYLWSIRSVNTSKSAFRDRSVRRARRL